VLGLARLHYASGLQAFYALQHFISILWPMWKRAVNKPRKTGFATHIKQFFLPEYLPNWLAVLLYEFEQASTCQTRLG
jgi:hypothetical protein